MARAGAVGDLAQRAPAEAVPDDVVEHIVEQGLSSHANYCTIRYMNQVVHVETTSAADPTAVFALLGEVETWTAWASAFDEAGLEREGGPQRQGVGAIRRFRVGRVRSREEVVAFEPGGHFAYTLLSGLPVRGYRADVTLTPVDGGTHIVWHSTFRARIPGTGGLIRRKLTAFITVLAGELAAAAAGSAGADVARAEHQQV